VGGYTSGSVLSNASANLADVASDLVIVAVGMNDMAGSITGAQFQSNLQQIIAAARWCNSATEVLLVSSWPSNPDWTLTNNQAFVDYNAAMYQLAGSTQGVSVADVTSAVWNSEMLNTKSFYDVTGNGVNHPNDWMYTLYAQTVLKSILGM
jgi:lysophospholipase L1-like esterase